MRIYFVSVKFYFWPLASPAIAGLDTWLFAIGTVNGETDGEYIASDEIIFRDATINSGSTISAYSGRIIRILPETFFKFGCKVLLAIDSTLVVP